MENYSIQQIKYLQFPLTIMANGEEFATVICSPTNLEELVIGFLASEVRIQASMN